MSNSFPDMASDANYPSDNGVSVSPLPDTPCLMEYDLLVGGTLGSGASYTAQVKDPNGSWVNLPNPLTAIGATSGKAYGSAMRVAAVNGSGAGTDEDTPKYLLTVRKLPQIPTISSVAQ